MTLGDFAAFHDRHRDRILAYLRRLTGNLALAEELAQEAFLRASRGRAGFRGASKPSTWLFRIATNVFLDHRRSRAARVEPASLTGEDVERVHPAPSMDDAPRLPDRLFEDSEMGRCVREYVDRLPPGPRAAIILHDLEGFTNPEIAEILGCSVAAVKIRVHRGRSELRDLLQTDCEFGYSDENVLQCDRRQPGSDADPE